jgi:hypothetical protein
MSRRMVDFLRSQEATSLIKYSSRVLSSLSSKTETLLALQGFLDRVGKKRPLTNGRRARRREDAAFLTPLTLRHVDDGSQFKLPGLSDDQVGGHDVLNGSPNGLVERAVEVVLQRLAGVGMFRQDFSQKKCGVVRC